MTEFQFLLLLVVVHALGFTALGLLVIPCFRTDDRYEDEDGDDGSDDGWGNRPNVAPKPSRWPGGGIPLPDAEPSGIRLREPGTIGSKLPPHERRPAREPAPVPHPARSRPD